MINKILFLMLVIFALFFPTKHYDIYHFSLLGGSVLLLLLTEFKVSLNFYAKYFAVLIFIITIGSFVSSIYLGADFFKNITEVFRFLPVLLLLLSYKVINFNKNQLDVVLYFYAFLVSTICLLQYLGVEAVLNLSKIYGSELQVENSLLLSSRAIGLSTGPGNNGALFTILYIYFFSSFLFFKENKIINSIFMFLCVLSVILSQSQTSLVALGFSSIFSLILILILDKKKFFNTSVFCIVFAMAFSFVFLFVKNLSKFGYLISLFNEGLSRNSYQVRMDKVSEVVDLSFSNPIMFFIGYGKDLVPNSTALDNEYVFYLGVYGFISVILMVLFYLSFILFIFRANKIYSDYVLCIMIFAGAIIAWPSSFTLDPRLLFILTILMIFSLREKEFYRNNRDSVL
ncbi:hypothetical protein [Acinetobacter sp. YH12114]|uniref:hypothetical protein n=1 Tax=Acinetobacter sp. YH12114 TaxID=2601101 RepID=UPI0015D4049B|nr:hypothetical protein [Acinetobacter sp. YH12114]